MVGDYLLTGDTIGYFEVDDYDSLSNSSANSGLSPVTLVEAVSELSLIFDTKITNYTTK